MVLSAAAILALCACNGKKDNNKSSEPDDPKQGFVDPEVELSDVSTPNMEIAFDEVSDNVMVESKVKTYIDAMEEQEKTLDKPYHFSALYGPDDYAKLASASDKGDGTTYAAADTGGVDVCQLLNRNDYGNDCKNVPIKLTFAADGDYANAVVKFWSTEDASDLREAKVTVSGDKASVSLENLFRARKYRVQVVNGDQVSNGFEFKTADYPRAMTMGGVHNVRDIGGYPTSYGVRTNQGLIYRGYYIDDKSGGHGVNYNDAVAKVQEEVMNIGYEIDLQKSSETNGRTKSCLVGADYKCLTLVSYENFLKESSYVNLPEVMSIIANSDVKHSYFHCWGGADRTGMLAFFINAICGVSYTDLIEDFELTTLTNNKRCHMHNSSNAHFPKFLNDFFAWSGYDKDKTVNDNCYRWMVDVAKVDANDLEKIREIMLPGYINGDLDENKLIPSYTPKDEWKTDDLAHWKEAKEDANVKCEWGRHTGAECSVCGKGGASQSGDAGNDTDFTQVLTRNWTVTSKANNAEGKEYEQIKDNAKNKVGVRILTKNYSDSTNPFSDGKLSSSGGTVTYKIKAPKAGVYQMIMNGRVSDDTKKLSERGITVTLNGATVDIDGANRDGGLSGQGDNDFVMCPTINLTGNEDVITVACKNYRIVFNLEAYVVFAEH